MAEPVEATKPFHFGKLNDRVVAELIETMREGQQRKARIPPSAGEDLQRMARPLAQLGGTPK